VPGLVAFTTSGQETSASIVTPGTHIALINMIMLHIEADNNVYCVDCVIHHHHIRLLEVVKRNRQHTVQKIDVGIYMDIHTIHAG